MIGDRTRWVLKWLLIASIAFLIHGLAFTFEYPLLVVVSSLVTVLLALIAIRHFRNLFGSR